MNYAHPVEECGNLLSFEDLTSYKIIYNDPAVEGEAEDLVPDRKMDARIARVRVQKLRRHCVCEGI